MSLVSAWKSQVFVTGSRLVLQMVLIFIFLYFFGVPAIKQFLAREVMVVKTLRNSWGKIAAPAITINARNPKTLRGWRGDNRDIEKACLQRNDSVTCIDNGTYNQSDIFNDVLLGYRKKLSLINVTNLWRRDYLRAVEGSIFTFNFLLSVGPNLWNDRLIFELSYALQYRFFIHDPKYFVLTWNNAYFPVTFLDSKPNTTNNFYIKFDLVEVREACCFKNG